MNQAVQSVIEKYYKSFNEGHVDGMVSCLHKDFVHDVNEGARNNGLEKFKKFLDHMNTCYKEELKDIHIMVNNNGDHAAAEFFVHGEYLETDTGLPAAHGQKYVIKAGTFFEIQDQKIKRVTTYYNLKEWIRQVSV